MSEEWSRRQFLGAFGLTVGAMALPAWPVTRADAAGFTGSRALLAAMHVHASWSEGAGSWDAQFFQAGTNAFDLLFMTDHDFRATATNYLTSLNDVTLLPSSTGSTSRQASTHTGESFRLLAESATTSPSSVALSVEPRPDAFNRMRTSIAGLALIHSVTQANLVNGARYEVTLTLSYHPAVAGRPAGQYRLVYRFGGTSGRWTEGGGLIGVVSAPTPAAGSVQTLRPEQDVAALWPRMLAIDNALYGLAFTARSPRHGAVADVSVASLRFSRTQIAAADVIAHQQSVIATYQQRYPGLHVHASTEISRNLPHMNPFGIPPWLPDYTTLSTDHDTGYRQMVSHVHAMGGVISWNHPFGYNGGPLLTQADQDAKRRQVYQSLNQVSCFGADILEVGYPLRGQVNMATHLALWDTFSRNARFLTGNGTTDDHSGQGWRSLVNGFATGLWAASPEPADVVAALSAGRAFTRHLGRWPSGQVDLLVDGTVPMGHVSVSTKTSRQLAILADALPAGSTVELVRGNADYSGANDPGTSVSRRLPASSFNTGPYVVTVDTTQSRFFRVQVVAADGGLIGTSNPVWLLREIPPAGIPPARS